ncbi:DUF6488 family protein [Pseudoalteromonas sp. 5-MNA-CIBAN-0065]|uniref:DUF6488 family protein n=1 Tax=unclassified Pseudoalteromonas TaxID=194690 RepID=UPI00332AAD23
MNKLISIVLVCITLMSTGVLAHSDHGHVSDQQAISIAAKSIKKLTFKDYGFEVGKLNDSWKNISSEVFSVVSEGDNYYVIKALNDDEQVYFKITKNGQLLDVKSKNDF